MGNTEVYKQEAKEIKTALDSLTKEKLPSKLDTPERYYEAQGQVLCLQEENKELKKRVEKTLKEIELELAYNAGHKLETGDLYGLQAEFAVLQEALKAMENKLNVIDLKIENMPIPKGLGAYLKKLVPKIPNDRTQLWKHEKQSKDEHETSLGLELKIPFDAAVESLREIYRTNPTDFMTMIELLDGIRVAIKHQATAEKNFGGDERLDILFNYSGASIVENIIPSIPEVERPGWLQNWDERLYEYKKLMDMLKDNSDDHHLTSKGKAEISRKIAELSRLIFGSVENAPTQEEWGIID